MHKGTQALGCLLVAVAIVLFMMSTQDAAGPLLPTYAGITGGIGITFLILSKVIGVLEEIRDRLPEPEKETQEA